MAQRVRPQSAFSLIELLVVIGIIGILLSLLLPVMGRVRDSARQIVCASMMRQVGTAMGAYIVDANQHLPFVLSALYAPMDTAGALDWSADPTDAAANPHELLPVLDSYLSDIPELVCPAAVLGYPRENPKLTYRTAAANNYDGKVDPVVQADGDLEYEYSLTYLDGRRYEIKHVVLTPSLELRLEGGSGYYYLLRDFVGKVEGESLMPHDGSVNQLYLDLHVSLFPEQDVFTLQSP